MKPPRRWVPQLRFVVFHSRVGRAGKPRPLDYVVRVIGEQFDADGVDAARRRRADPVRRGLLAHEQRGAIDIQGDQVIIADPEPLLRPEDPLVPGGGERALGDDQDRRDDGAACACRVKTIPRAIRPGGRVYTGAAVRDSPLTQPVAQGFTGETSPGGWVRRWGCLGTYRHRATGCPVAGLVVDPGDRRRSRLNRCECVIPRNASALSPSGCANGRYMSGITFRGPGRRAGDCKCAS